MPENQKTMHFRVELTEEQWMFLTRTIYPASESSEMVQELYNELGNAKIVWK